MKKIYRDRAKLKPRVETARVMQSCALPVRAEEVLMAQSEIDAIFMRLFADENFITLLQAESLTTIPSRFECILKRSETCE